MKVYVHSIAFLMLAATAGQLQAGFETYYVDRSGQIYDRFDDRRYGSDSGSELDFWTLNDGDNTINGALLRHSEFTVSDIVDVSWISRGGGSGFVVVERSSGFSPVPEPSSVAMWGLAGAVGLVVARRRKRLMVA
jgi:hypothetical protein